MNKEEIIKELKLINYFLKKETKKCDEDGWISEEEYTRGYIEGLEFAILEIGDFIAKLKGVGENSNESIKGNYKNSINYFGWSGLIFGYLHIDGFIVPPAAPTQHRS